MKLQSHFTYLFIYKGFLRKKSKKIATSKNIIFDIEEFIYI